MVFRGLTLLYPEKEVYQVFCCEFLLEPDQYISIANIIVFVIIAHKEYMYICKEMFEAL